MHFCFVDVPSKRSAVSICSWFAVKKSLQFATNFELCIAPFQIGPALRQPSLQIGHTTTLGSILFGYFQNKTKKNTKNTKQTQTTKQYKTETIEHDR